MLISFQKAAVVLNLVPLENDYTPSGLIGLQEEFQKQNILFVNVWEDVWQSRRKQVLSRVQSMLGGNQTIHGRITKVVRISSPEARVFLDENHLQGAVKARYNLALVEGGQIMAVACFSNLRRMTQGSSYRSAELVRFVNLSGYTVAGGFTKLVKYFMETYRPDDIMSYADRDWSTGRAYEKGGFRLAGITAPADIYVDRNTMKRYFAHRRPEKGDFVKIFNTGNLKYILKS